MFGDTLAATAVGNTDADHESRDELRRRLDAQRVYAVTLKEDAERTQKKLLAAEMRIAELVTTAAVSKTAAEEARAAASTATEHAKALCAATEARAAMAVERLRFAPQIDNSVRRLYCELRHGAAASFAAEPLTEADLAELPKKNILELAEDCRLWTRWLLESAEALKLVASQQQARRLAQTRIDVPSPNVDAPSVASLSVESSPTRSGGPRKTVRIQRKEDVVRALKESALVSESSPAVPTESDGDLDSLREQLRVVAAREERLEKAAEVARRDCAAARQEVRNHVQTVEELQAHLAKRDASDAAEAVQQRCRTEEIKRAMSVALSAKQQEIDVLKRGTDRRIRTLLAENAALKKQRRDAVISAAEVTQLKEATRSAELQLTRSGIQSSAQEVARLKKICDERQAKILQMEQEIRALQLTNRRLRHDCDIATGQYNAIFAAHHEDARMRRAAKSAAEETAMKSVIQSGVIELQEYREQCKEARAENKRLKRKLQQLAWQQQRQRIRDLSRTASTDSDPQGGGAFEGVESETGADDGGAAEDTMFQSVRDHALRAIHDADISEADDEWRRILLDDSTPSTTPFIRVDPDHVMLNTTLPLYGASTQFGGPTDLHGTSHVVAATQSTGEVSTRVVKRVQDQRVTLTPSPFAKRPPRALLKATGKQQPETLKTLLSERPFSADLARRCGADSPASSKNRRPLSRQSQQTR